MFIQVCQTLLVGFQSAIHGHENMSKKLHRKRKKNVSLDCMEIHVEETYIVEVCVLRFCQSFSLPYVYIQREMKRAVTPVGTITERQYIFHVAWFTLPLNYRQSLGLTSFANEAATGNQKKENRFFFLVLSLSLPPSLSLSFPLSVSPPSLSLSPTLLFSSLEHIRECYYPLRLLDSFSRNRE